MQLSIFEISRVCAFTSKFMVAENVAHNKFNNERKDHFLGFLYRN